VPLHRIVLSLLAFVLALVPVLASASLARSAEHCHYQLGFATLHAMIPEIVGDCVTDEFHNPETGDTLQVTENGLLVWRKADNWTAFTDGHRTWVHGPFGIQSRLNTERFDWEAPAPPAPVEQPVCLQDGGFVESGHIATFPRDPGDARLVRDFRLGIHPGCERLVIDLGTNEETPAEAVGHVAAEFLRDRGIVRVHLGEEFDLVELVGTETDADLDGTLIDRAFLVRSLDGSDGRLYIDVHLAQPVLARVLVLDAPARIVLDVQPNGAPLPAAPAVAGNVVVLWPRPEAPPATASYPLTVTGYARTFEANVLGIIRSNGQIALEDFTTAASWAETWGEFELTIEDGPRGEIELFVGERSARDGTEQGARIRLVMQ
jgi:hypothetical protein